MYPWIITFWVIGSIMACWSFSLFVRWVSEATARRKRQLIAQRSTRSFWIGFSLIFICAATAIGSAMTALHIEKLFGDTYDPWTTPITIISSTIILFGLFLIVWGLIGDRARGRTRCPKCWYDMSGAVGLRCPECGKEAKSTKQFTKSKRPKWAFVVAALLMGLSVYGFSVNRRVAETDWLAAVPSWFLMAGWALLPEEWILYDNSPYESTLDQRFEAQWYGWNDQVDEDAWISNRRARRFGRRLTRGMVKDQNSRWDARRLSLISATYSHIVYQRYEDEKKRTWTGLPIDVNALLLASAEDLVDAIVTDDPSEQQLEMIEKLWHKSEWGWSPDTPYSLAMNGLVQTTYADFPEPISDNPELKRQYFIDILRDTQAQHHGLLAEQQERILSPAFTRNLTDLDEYRQKSSMELAKDAGVLDQLLDLFLDSAPDPEKMDPKSRAYAIADAARAFSTDGYMRLLHGLDPLVKSKNPLDFAHAIMILQWLPSTRPYDEDSADELYNSVFDLAIERAIENHKPMYPEEKYSESFHEAGLAMIVEHDITGQRAFPLVLKELLADPTEAPDLRYSSDPFEPNTHIKAWVENFAQLADDDDPDIKEWLIRNLPVELGTPHDELIDEIAVRFLDDPDEDLRYTAMQKLTERLAEHLLTN